MKFRNCPNCCTVYDTKSRKYVPYGPCSYCHGNRKISVEFYDWEQRRRKFEKVNENKIQDDLDFEFEKRMKECLEKWDEKHPKPRKFPGK